MKECRIKKERELKDKLDEARRNWEKVLPDVSAFLQEQKSSGKWTAKDHRASLKSLRKDKNEKAPKKKKDLEESRALWKDRVPLAVNDLGHRTLEAEDEEMADGFDLCVSGEQTDGSSNPAVPSVAT